MADRYTNKKARDLAAASESGRYGVLLQTGSMELGYYQPRGEDPQSPHDQDEVYVVDAGHGVFVLDGKRQPFEQGEALFVPAGVDHRFEDFSDDFSAWVVFYGPPGGEQGG